MSFSELISPLVGRWLLAWFFLDAAWTRALDWDSTLTLMSMSKIPYGPLLLAAALIVMLLGGLSLLFGFHAAPRRRSAVCVHHRGIGAVACLLEDPKQSCGAGR